MLLWFSSSEERFCFVTYLTNLYLPFTTVTRSKQVQFTSSTVHSPYKEAEQAEECVHEANVVGNAGDDCLLAVWTHSLHRRGLEHFPLQYRHGGGCTWWTQDCCCLSSHVHKVAGAWTHLTWYWASEVPGRQWVGATCKE